jgi:hypothetical protein
MKTMLKKITAQTIAIISTLLLTLGVAGAQTYNTSSNSAASTTPGALPSTGQGGMATEAMTILALIALIGTAAVMTKVQGKKI